MLQNLLHNSSDVERVTKLLPRILSMFNQKLSDEELTGMVKLWVEGTHDLTTSELETGYRWVMNCGMQFMPSLPLFRFRCKGLISEQEAFGLIAIDELHTNPAAYLAFENVKKQCDWSRLTLKLQRKEFNEQYDIICHKVMEKRLNLKPVELETKAKEEKAEEMTQEERIRIGSKFIEQIKKQFNFKTKRV